MAAIQTLANSALSHSEREHSYSKSETQVVQREPLLLAITAGGLMMGWLLASVPHSAVMLAALMLCAGLAIMTIRLRLQTLHKHSNSQSCGPVYNLAAAHGNALPQVQTRLCLPVHCDYDSDDEPASESHEYSRRFYLM